MDNSKYRCPNTNRLSSQDLMEARDFIGARGVNGKKSLDIGVTSSGRLEGGM
jgi:hypothetical protein